MLTIIAWMVFIPAAVWAVIFFGVALADVFGKNEVDWRSRRNVRDTVLTLALLLIPGVYLFGWF